MLIAVITIIVGVIKFSLMFVYVKIIENINKNIIVVINDIIIPFIIFEIDVVIFYLHDISYTYHFLLSFFVYFIHKFDFYDL